MSSAMRTFSACLFLVMNVETTANISLKRSIGRVAWHASIQYPAVLPGVVPHPIFHLKGRRASKLLT